VVSVTCKNRQKRKWEKHETTIKITITVTIRKQNYELLIDTPSNRCVKWVVDFYYSVSKIYPDMFRQEHDNDLQKHVGV
jgi:hypothetical protein